MTDQKVFNKIAKHLLKQKAKAIHDGYCVFYDPESKNRCAIGCLLPLKYYKAHTEVYLSVDNPCLNNNIDLIRDLRYCHDFIKVSRWPQRLRAIAKKYKLEIPNFLMRKKNEF